MRILSLASALLVFALVLPGSSHAVAPNLNQSGTLTKEEAARQSRAHEAKEREERAKAEADAKRKHFSSPKKQQEIIIHMEENKPAE